MDAVEERHQLHAILVVLRLAPSAETHELRLHDGSAVSDDLLLDPPVAVLPVRFVMQILLVLMLELHFFFC